MTEQHDHIGASDAFSETEDYVTFVIAGQLFGIPVLRVQDVLSWHQITPIPLAPPEIAGSLNLRGRIVTAIDVRLRLGLPSATRVPEVPACPGCRSSSRRNLAEPASGARGNADRPNDRVPFGRRARHTRTPTADTSSWRRSRAA